MLKKDRIKPLVIKFLEKIFFPKFSNAICKTVISLGSILILSQIPALLPEIFNRIIEVVNSKFELNISSFNNDPDHFILIIGVVLVIAVLLFLFGIKVVERISIEPFKSTRVIEISKFNIIQPVSPYQFELARCHVLLEGTNPDTSVISMMMVVKKRWDYCLARTVGTIERYTCSQNENTLLVPAYQNDSNKVNLVGTITGNGDLHVSFSLCTDQIVVDRKGLSECEGFIVYLVDLVFNIGDNEEKHHASILVVLYGGWAKTIHSYPMTREEVLQDIESLGSITNLASKGNPIAPTIVTLLEERRAELINAVENELND